MSYTLEGVNGNAYAIMGYTARALKEAGLGDLVDQMYAEAKAGDYDNLIVICMGYVEMANSKIETNVDVEIPTPINPAGGKDYE